MFCPSARVLRRNSHPSGIHSLASGRLDQDCIPRPLPPHLRSEMRTGDRTGRLRYRPGSAAESRKSAGTIAVPPGPVRGSAGGAGRRVSVSGARALRWVGSASRSCRQRSPNSSHIALSSSILAVPPGLRTGRLWWCGAVSLLQFAQPDVQPAGSERRRRWGPARAVTPVFGRRSAGGPVSRAGRARPVAGHGRGSPACGSCWPGEAPRS